MLRDKLNRPAIENEILMSPDAGTKGSSRFRVSFQTRETPQEDVLTSAFSVFSCEFLRV
ncbi:hypothetical protein K0M31_016646 [Melipona bicolor]|uniref:Uncharacterized protein n=1 Tax=Melipona bicolor TaxID=60889 RepID=A0AA40KEJ1_9HYME|nr:hypothetical protein K0M31_016646 [Melipona bicolor]